MILGITGGIASGKSEVSRILKAKGFEHIDADLECKNIIENNADAINEIVNLLGIQVLNSDGSLNKSKIAEFVFTDKELLIKYNEIVQSKALLVCLDRIDYCKSNSINAIFDVPLLFETGWNKYCDIVLTVSCDEELRIKRALSRGSVSIEDIKNRMASQLKDIERESLADIVIYNNGNLDELADNVLKSLAKYNI